MHLTCGPAFTFRLSLSQIQEKTSILATSKVKSIKKPELEQTLALDQINLDFFYFI